MALSKITNDGIDNITIDSSGNVGIGTSSPSAALHAYNSAGGIVGLVEAASGYSARVRIQSGNANDSFLEFADPDDSDVGEIVYNHASNFMRFNTNAAERMRLDSSGLLMVNTTSNVGTQVTFNCGNREGVRIINNSGATQYPMAFINGTSTVGSISTSTTNTAYNTSSDHRLKENDVDMTGAITRVKQLQPKRFNFIADPDDTTVDGFMAHEVQTVVPEAITGTHNEVDDDGNPVYQGIDQSKLVPLLTGALQEAIAKIETLEAKVTALENA